MSLGKILAPVFIAIILGAAAAFAVWAQEPFLAPSLGSSVFSQLLHPQEKSANPYAIVAGQILGAAAGFTGVFVAGAAIAPPFIGNHPLTWVRVVAIVVAGLLAATGQVATGALTPAGGATALVVALGAETDDWKGVIRLSVGLVIVTGLGEVARQFLLRQHQATPE